MAVREDPYTKDEQAPEGSEVVAKEEGGETAEDDNDLDDEAIAEALARAESAAKKQLEEEPRDHEEGEGGDSLVVMILWPLASARARVM